MTTKDKALYKLSSHPDSPCLNCLVQITCTKSILEKSACDDYKQYILKLVEIEKCRSKGTL